jgi:predicted transcriptional regulator
MAETGVAKAAEDELLRMTTEVVAAYVSNNTLATGQLGDVIHAVYNSLRSLDGQAAEAPPEVLKPAVPVRKSITPEFLVCLEDGKKLKMLKRHLRSTYNLSPDEYRAKWGLAPDYPMVAPKYAQQRSEFAKKIGLGRGTGRRAGRAAKKKRPRRARREATAKGRSRAPLSFAATPSVILGRRGDPTRRPANRVRGPPHEPQCRRRPLI